MNAGDSPDSPSQRSHAIIGVVRAGVFDRAERERTGGRLWRAREILEGSLPILGYDVELYERLGVVLLEMGDLPRA